VVKRLIACGANVNKTNKLGLTALMLSSYKGNLSIVTEIINHGADVEVLNKAGRSSLTYASLNGHLSIVKLLIENMPDAKKAINDGPKSLLWASSMGHPDVVKTLVESGADEKCVVATLLDLVAVIKSLKTSHRDVAQVLSKKCEIHDTSSFNQFNALTVLQ